jgi:tetratricopeptide (TPR) repeat protein
VTRGEWTQRHRSAAPRAMKALLTGLATWVAVQDGKGAALGSDVVIAAPLPMAADDPQEVLKAARNLRSQGRFPEAVDALTKLIADHPDLAEAYAERSGAFSFQIRASNQSAVKEASSPKAIADATKAIELDGTKPGYRLVRGFAFEVSGQPARAVEDYSEVVRLRPNEASSWSSRARAHFLLKQWERVIEDETKAIALDPSDAYCWNFRGLASDELSRADQAMQDYSQALRLNPAVSSFWQNRGELRSRLGQFALAIDDPPPLSELRFPLPTGKPWAWAHHGSSPTR